MDENGPVIRVRELRKTFRVPEREAGLRASLKSLVRRTHRDVHAVAGVSFRPEAVSDSSFDPGARLALVPEPENAHDPNAIGIWNAERTLQAGYVPRDTVAELAGDELAVSLWRAGADGLRVLLVPSGSWVGKPRR